MKLKKLLVPTDFSSASLAALEHAMKVADPRSTQVVLLHVIDSILWTPTHYASGTIDPATVLGELQQDARKQLERVRRQWRTRLPRFHTVLILGSPASTIVAEAKKLKADMIVIATHGRTGLKHLLLSSVAERVVRTASCPVLTVRSAGRAVRVRRPRPVTVKRRTRAA